MGHTGYTNATDKVLYIGVTDSLKRRLGEHTDGQALRSLRSTTVRSSFTSRHFRTLSRPYPAKSNLNTSNGLGRMSLSKQLIHFGAI